MISRYQSVKPRKFSVKQYPFLNIDIDKIGIIKCIPFVNSPLKLLNTYRNYKLSDSIYCIHEKETTNHPQTQLQINHIPKFMCLLQPITKECSIAIIDSFNSPITQYLINFSLMEIMNNLLIQKFNATIIQSSANKSEFIVEFKVDKRITSKEIEMSYNYILSEFLTLGINNENNYEIKYGSERMEIPNSNIPLFYNLKFIKSIKIHKFVEINSGENIFRYKIISIYLPNYNLIYINNDNTTTTNTNNNNSEKEYNSFLSNLTKYYKNLFERHSINDIIKNQFLYLSKTEEIVDIKEFLSKFEMIRKDIESLVKSFVNDRNLGLKIYLRPSFFQNNPEIRSYIIEHIENKFDHYQQFNTITSNQILKIELISYSDKPLIIYSFGIYPSTNNDTYRIEYNFHPTYFSYLFENTGLKPFNFSTRQIMFIPFNDVVCVNFAEKWLKFCTNLNISCAIDYDNLQKNYFTRLRSAFKKNYNFIAVIGKKECQNETIELRKNHVQYLNSDIKNKSITLNQQQLELFISRLNEQ